MAQLTSTTVTGNLAVTGTIISNEIKNSDGSIAAVPPSSTANNNQFLRVVNGVPTWSTVPNAEGVSF